LSWLFFGLLLVPIFSADVVVFALLVLFVFKLDTPDFVFVLVFAFVFTLRAGFCAFGLCSGDEKPPSKSSKSALSCPHESSIKSFGEPSVSKDRGRPGFGFGFDVLCFLSGVRVLLLPAAGLFTTALAGCKMTPLLSFAPPPGDAALLLDCCRPLNYS
jgi:hypothetical protein